MFNGPDGLGFLERIGMGIGGGMIGATLGFVVGIIGAAVIGEPENVGIIIGVCIGAPIGFAASASGALR